MCERASEREREREREEETTPITSRPLASEEGTTLNVLGTFLKSKARTWPRPSYVCRVCSTVDAGSSRVAASMLRLIGCFHLFTCPCMRSCRGSSRSFAAFRKDAGLYCGSRLLEGRSVCLCWAKSKPKGPRGAPDGVRQPLRHGPEGVLRDLFAPSLKPSHNLTLLEDPRPGWFNSINL